MSFTTKKGWNNDGNNGSLILSKKAEFGYDIIEGIIRRYFRDIEVDELLSHKENIVISRHSSTSSRLQVDESQIPY